MMQKIATREAYGKALVKYGAQYRDMVVLDADLAKSTKTADFAKAFPDRFFDIGIAEQNLMSTAAGLAAAGKIVFASTFAIFAVGRAYDQVRNSIAYPHLNVKIGASHAGITVGEDGGSHQTIEDIALMRVLPNMTVIVPADATETEQAVAAAIELDGPVYLRLGRLGVPVLYDQNYRFTLGQAVRLRTGKDAAIIATGVMVTEAIEAARMLAEQGIEITVLNIHTIKPLDAESIIAVAKESGAIVTAEEHSIIGGLGGAVAETLAENWPVPIKRVGVMDRFGESGTPAELMEKLGLTARHLVAAVKEVLDKKLRSR